jgi:uncharacterized protein (DUF58 family)
VAALTGQPAQAIARKIACLTEVPQRSWLGLQGWPTRAGWGMIAMLVLLGLVAANPGLNLLLLLCGLGAGAMLFNALLARWQVNLAQVKRILPEVAAAGRPSVIRYQVSNRSRWMALRSLWIVDDHARGRQCLPVRVTWIPHVPAGGTSRAEVRVVPLHRGLCRVESIRLASRFPFGLYKRLRTICLPDTLLVWPALWQPRINWLSHAPRASTTNPSRNGQWQPGADEFFGMREYRPGDNVRWIHWRRSASLDRVLVREMVQSNPGRVTLALETAGGAGPADPDLLDTLVSAAASLACDALERGWHVGLILNGQPTVVLPPAGGRAVRTRLLYELAILEAASQRRLCDVLDDWPAGPAWAGRAVLLYPSGADNAGISAALGRLAAAVGPVAALSSATVPGWFDLSTAPAHETMRLDTPPVEPVRRGPP